MLIYTMKYSRRKAAAAAALAFLLLSLAVLLLRGGAGQHADDSNPCVEYLTSLGWTVESEPIETLSLTLPAELTEPYLSYNALQLAQGFDLAPYCDRKLTRCTYTITNHPSGSDAQADLYLCGGTIVAGDIVCIGEGGFIAPLAYPEQT